MGHDLNSDPTACKDLLDDGNLPAQYSPLEHFVCKVYPSKAPLTRFLVYGGNYSARKTWKVRSSYQLWEHLYPHIL